MNFNDNEQELTINNRSKYNVHMIPQKNLLIDIKYEI